MSRATNKKKPVPIPVKKETVITIRIRPEQEKLLEDIKEHFKVKAATKALMKAANLVLTKYKDLIQRHTEVSQELTRALSWIRQLQNDRENLITIEKKISSRLDLSYTPQLSVSDAFDTDNDPFDNDDEFDDNDY